MAQEVGRSTAVYVLPGTQMEKSAVVCAAGRRRPGARAHQSDRHGARARLQRLRRAPAADLADSMSVALENARLFDETQRRTRESAALAEVGRDISSTLDLATVMDRIARHAKELLGADNSAIFLPESRAPARARLPRHRRPRRHRRAVRGARSTRRAKASSAASSSSGRAEFVNDTGADPRAVQIAGTLNEQDERLMVAPLRPATRSRARWPSGAPRGAVRRTRSGVPGRAVAGGHRGDGERPPVRRDRSSARPSSTR